MKPSVASEECYSRQNNICNIWDEQNMGRWAAVADAIAATQ